MININTDPLAVDIFMKAMAKVFLDLDGLPAGRETAESLLLRLDHHIDSEKIRSETRGLDPGREVGDLRLVFGDIVRNPSKYFSEHKSPQE